MSEAPPNPPGEQPRYFTAFDMFWELVSVGCVCGGFYAGYSLKGFWTGFVGGVIGRGIFLIVVMAMQDWMDRRRRS